MVLWWSSCRVRDGDRGSLGSSTPHWLLFPLHRLRPGLKTCAMFKLSHSRRGLCHPWVLRDAHTSGCACLRPAARWRSRIHVFTVKPGVTGRYRRTLPSARLQPVPADRSKGWATAGRKDEPWFVAAAPNPAWSCPWQRCLPRSECSWIMMQGLCPRSRRTTALAITSKG